MQFDLAKFQKEFSNHIRNSDPGNAEGLHLSTQRDAASFGVYKNNYRLTLFEHLTAIFPVCAKFVGSDFLGMAIREYVQSTPPATEIMHEYGESFPGFLTAYEHLADVRYVADIASIEWYIHTLQFVKEAEGLPSAALNPAMYIVKSRFPLLRLWMVGAGQLAPEAVHITSGSENVAVVLTNAQVLLQPISEEELSMLNALQEHRSWHTEEEKPVFVSCQNKGFIV